MFDYKDQILIGGLDGKIVDSINKFYSRSISYQDAKFEIKKEIYEILERNYPLYLQSLSEIDKEIKQKFPEVACVPAAMYFIKEHASFMGDTTPFCQYNLTSEKAFAAVVVKNGIEVATHKQIFPNTEYDFVEGSKFGFMYTFKDLPHIDIVEDYLRWADSGLRFLSNVNYFKLPDFKSAPITFQIWNVLGVLLLRFKFNWVSSTAGYLFFPALDNIFKPITLTTLMQHIQMLNPKYTFSLIMDELDQLGKLYKITSSQGYYKWLQDRESIGNLYRELQTSYRGSSYIFNNFYKTRSGKEEDYNEFMRGAMEEFKSLYCESLMSPEIASEEI